MAETKPNKHFRTIEIQKQITLTPKPLLLETDLLHEYQTYLSGYFTKLKRVNEKAKYLICDEPSKMLIETAIGSMLQSPEFHIEDILLPSEIQNCRKDSNMHFIFIVSSLSSLREVGEAITIIKNSNKDIREPKEYFTLLRTFCTEMWDIEMMRFCEISSNCHIERLPITLPVINKDIVSMQIPDAYLRLYSNYDYGLLQLCANGLNDLQRSIGLFPKIHTFGRHSRRLTIDIATPSMMAYNYASMLDKAVHVNDDISTVNIDPAYLDQAISFQSLNDLLKDKTETIFPLHGENYERIRDLEFSEVPDEMSTIMKQFEEEFQKHLRMTEGSDFASNNAKKRLEFLPKHFASKTFFYCHNQFFSEILTTARSFSFRQEREKQFKYVANAREALSFSIFNDFNPFAEVEEMVYENPTKDVFPENSQRCYGKIPFPENIVAVLSRLSLLCALYGGIRSSDYESFRKTFIQTYGLWTISLLSRLEAAGLIFRSDGPKKRSFSDINRSIRSLSKETDYAECMSVKGLDAIYDHYQPLIVAVVERFLQHQVNPVDVTKKIINEDGLEEIPEVFNYDDGVIGDTKLDKLFPKDDRSFTKVIGEEDPHSKYIFVFVIGGITFGEISMLRLIGQKFGKEVIIGTTNVLHSTNTLMHQFIKSSLDEHSSVTTKTN
ncbi:Sec1 family domain containing protein [Entamoeba marina]